MEKMFLNILLRCCKPWWLALCYLIISLLWRCATFVIFSGNTDPLTGQFNGMHYISKVSDANRCPLLSLVRYIAVISLALPKLSCGSGDIKYPIQELARCQRPVGVRFITSVQKGMISFFNGDEGLKLSYTVYYHSPCYVGRWKVAHPEGLTICMHADLQCKTKNIFYHEALAWVSLILKHDSSKHEYYKWSLHKNIARNHSRLTISLLI